MLKKKKKNPYELGVAMAYTSHPFPPSLDLEILLFIFFFLSLFSIQKINVGRISATW
jgi:hypothetical protein